MYILHPPVSRWTMRRSRVRVWRSPNRYKPSQPFILIKASPLSAPTTLTLNLWDNWHKDLWDILTSKSLRYLQEQYFNVCPKLLFFQYFTHFKTISGHLIGHHIFQPKTWKHSNTYLFHYISHNIFMVIDGREWKLIAHIWHDEQIYTRWHLSLIGRRAKEAIKIQHVMHVVHVMHVM